VGSSLTAIFVAEAVNLNEAPLSGI
jgi:hypothetical protein